MHFIGPLAALDGGLARSSCEDARHRRAVLSQMLHEAMLFEQSFAVAHRSVMALDEDSSAARRHHAGRGKRPRTHRENLDRLAAAGKLGKQRARFGQRERRPVGLDQLAVQSMRLCVGHRLFIASTSIQSS